MRNDLRAQHTRLPAPKTPTHHHIRLRRRQKLHLLRHPRPLPNRRLLRLYIHQNIRNLLPHRKKTLLHPSSKKIHPSPQFPYILSRPWLLSSLVAKIFTPPSPRYVCLTRYRCYTARGVVPQGCPLGPGSAGTRSDSTYREPHGSQSFRTLRRVMSDNVGYVNSHPACA